MNAAELPKSFVEVKGKRMAYVEMGKGTLSSSSTAIRHPPISGATSCPMLPDRPAAWRPT